MYYQQVQSVIDKQEQVGILRFDSCGVCVKTLTALVCRRPSYGKKRKTELNINNTFFETTLMNTFKLLKQY